MTKKINPLIPCACECGQQLLKYDKKNRPRKYLRGHYSKHYKETSAKHLVEYSKANKGKTELWTKTNIKARASRYRALRILKKSLGKTECEINNNDCGGKLEVHHIDKNPLNNEISNLTLLCQSHHRIADIRNLTPQELKSLNLIYYVDKTGARRYKK